MPAILNMNLVCNFLLCVNSSSVLHSCLVILEIFLFSPLQLVSQNSVDAYQFIIQNKTNLERIAYAHISHNYQLLAISDYNGKFQMAIDESNEYKISCIGYQAYFFNSGDVTPEKLNTIRLEPDLRILDAIVVTPETLENMIAEVYYNIPKKYPIDPHLLQGILEERYVDTSGHINIFSFAKINVKKSGYQNKQVRNEVRVDSLYRIYDVTQVLSYKISAGAHIPHRFDFVMRKEEFIHPKSFSKYDYSYLGDIEQGGRKLDVIRFSPKSETFTGANFRGKMYLDLEEKVFVKAEYFYTKAGLFSDRHSAWAEKRMFITEYAPNNGIWYLSYTWDEATNKKQNFVLKQVFQTKAIYSDSLVDWSYDERFQYQEILEQKKADSLIVVGGSINAPKPEKTIFKRYKIYNTLNRLSMSFGLRAYALQSGYWNINAQVPNGGSGIVLQKSFNVWPMDIGLFFSYNYNLIGNTFLLMSFSENFNPDIKLSTFEAGVTQRLPLLSKRPSFVGLSVSYRKRKTRFIFEKNNDYKPILALIEKGITGSLSYEFDLNTRWKLGIASNYFYSIGSNSSQLYLEKKTGFLNLFTEKKSVDIGDINLTVNGELSTTAPQTFKAFSFDLKFTYLMGI